MKIALLLTLITFSEAFGGSPCGGAQVGYWTNSDGSRGGWVANTAKVETGVYLGPNVEVCEYARIKSGARVLDNAVVSGRTVIFSGAEISGRANVSGESKIGGNPGVTTKITGQSFIQGSPTITGATLISGKANVSGKSKIHNSSICQSSRIEGFDVIDSDYYCQTEDPQPKHPGEMGEKTLLGVDSDRDGVRDDVEIWINETYSNTPNEDMYNYRMAMKQYSRSKLDVLKYNKLPAKVINATLESLDAFDCLESIFIDKTKKVSVRIAERNKIVNKIEDLEEVMFNTKERVMTELRTRKYLHGLTLKGLRKSKDGCYFGSKKND